MKCPERQLDNPGGAGLCGKCGTRLRPSTRSCSPKPGLSKRQSEGQGSAPPSPRAARFWKKWGTGGMGGVERIQDGLESAGRMYDLKKGEDDLEIL